MVHIHQIEWWALPGSNKYGLGGGLALASHITLIEGGGDNTTRAAAVLRLLRWTSPSVDGGDGHGHRPSNAFSLPLSRSADWLRAAARRAERQEPLADVLMCWCIIR